MVRVARACKDIPGFVAFADVGETGWPVFNAAHVVCIENEWQASDPEIWVCTRIYLSNGRILRAQAALDELEAAICESLARIDGAAPTGEGEG